MQSINKPSIIHKFTDYNVKFDNNKHVITFNFENAEPVKITTTRNLDAAALKDVINNIIIEGNYSVCGWYFIKCNVLQEQIDLIMAQKRDLERDFRNLRQNYARKYDTITYLKKQLKKINSAIQRERDNSSNLFKNNKFLKFKCDSLENENAKQNMLIENLKAQHVHLVNKNNLLNNENDSLSSEVVKLTEEVNRLKAAQTLAQYQPYLYYPKYA
jgi:peptidoglycan hydrolase CwlO-like protein